jgi:alpha-L-rhamnosidase
VWNEAQHRPAAQVSIRTAFILQGRSAAEQILNTNESWKCFKDDGRQPIPGYFFAASKGEFIDMNKAVKGDWTANDFDDSRWPAASKYFDGKPKGMSWGSDWLLTPSPLPAMEMVYQRIPLLRQATGITVPRNFPAKRTPLTIPANTRAVLLLDQVQETNAYVTLNFSGGKDAGISIGYAEALYDKGSKGTRKGNRNEIKDKEFVGRQDSLVSNGLNNQSFTTLNFRTYRYMQLCVQTKDQPLVIDDLYGTFTAYPFKRVSAFNTKDPDFKQILDIGWHTARLNAWESYTDCPYYEQLQYIGDTRIQALISYFNTDDDRLARNALNMMDQSRLPDGITRSCYPSQGTQIISTFSLWYICMLHDYWMYRPDSAFVKHKLPGVRGILDFFANYQQADGSLKNAPYWTFVDWANGKNWNIGAPPVGTDGSSSIVDMQLLLAYEMAADMESREGLKEYAEIYRNKATQLRQTIQNKYWDSKSRLFADTKEKDLYSQHANALAILADVADSNNRRAIAQKLLTDSTLTQCTVYFKYYLHQALIKSGRGNDYMSWLSIWRDNIKMGLTTWAEYSDLNFTRSDCHAWGSSPNIEFFRTVLGVDSDAPGFAKVKIEPHLGRLTQISGEVPHPAGKLKIDYKQVSGKWRITITMPDRVSGSFVWKSGKYSLHASLNKFMLD